MENLEFKSDYHKIFSDAFSENALITTHQTCSVAFVYDDGSKLILDEVGNVVLVEASVDYSGGLLGD